MKDFDEEVLAEKVGGRFKLAALVQKRMRELLLSGDAKVIGNSTKLLDTVLQEIWEGKIDLEPPPEETDIAEVTAAKEEEESA
jgi:DNA-directed RNA polymerase subunit K/omega